MKEPYHFVRFRWWNKIDVEGMAGEFKEKYSINLIIGQKDDYELTLRRDERTELRVKSDTLTAFLSPFRAVLTQKKAEPFTEKDLTLREKVLELYPRNRPTPFPMLFVQESKFESRK
jgi:hypothetical protein